MIKNEKQYKVTKKRLVDFLEALNDIEIKTDIDPILKQMQIDSVKSQIEDFKKEIEEYEFLKKGDLKYIVISSIDNLEEAFIKARIARGWTQSELAEKVNLHTQQIQRYEECNYSTASLPRLKDISNALELHVCPIKIELQNAAYNFSKNINPETLQRAEKRLLKYKSILEVSNT